MGVDINLFVERREAKYSGTDCEWLAWARVEVDRCYPLFAAMAGIRNETEWEVAPVAELRGLPENADVSRGEMEQDGGWSPSWLWVEEFQAAVELAQSKMRERDLRAELAPLMAALQVLSKEPGQCRLVFYFD